jgi:hypothetical protein
LHDTEKQFKVIDNSDNFSDPVDLKQLEEILFSPELWLVETPAWVDILQRMNKYLSPDQVEKLRKAEYLIANYFKNQTNCNPGQLKEIMHEADIVLFSDRIGAVNYHVNWGLFMQEWVSDIQIQLTLPDRLFEPEKNQIYGPLIRFLSLNNASGSQISEIIAIHDRSQTAAMHKAITFALPALALHGQNLQESSIRNVHERVLDQMIESDEFKQMLLLDSDGQKNQTDSDPLWRELNDKKFKINKLSSSDHEERSKEIDKLFEVLNETVKNKREYINRSPIRIYENGLGSANLNNLDLIHRKFIDIVKTLDHLTDYVDDNSSLSSRMSCQRFNHKFYSCYMFELEKELFRIYKNKSGKADI